MPCDESEILSLLRELKDGATINMRELLAASGWTFEKMRDFLLGYSEKPLTPMDPLPKNNTFMDAIWFHGLKTVPVFQVGGISEPEPEQTPDYAPVSAVPEAYMGQNEIIIPVDRLFSEKELIKMLAGQLGQYYAEETAGWWEQIGHVVPEPTPAGLTGLYGKIMYRTVPTLPPPVEVTRIVMHELPRTTWFVSRKGGLYDYLQNKFGWSRSEAVTYFREKLSDSSTRLRQVGQYRVPKEIPIEEKMTIERKEPKPLPQKLVSILRWDANKSHSYNQQFEWNVYIRLPRAMPSGDREQALMDIMQTYLEARKYPGIRTIISSWHGAVWMGTTTTAEQADGDVKENNNGNIPPPGFVDPKGVYSRYGVSVGAEIRNKDELKKEETK